MSLIPPTGAYGGAGHACVIGLFYVRVLEYPPI
jgi:hypothetical protein